MEVIIDLTDSLSEVRDLINTLDSYSMNYANRIIVIIEDGARIYKLCTIKLGEIEFSNNIPAKFNNLPKEFGQ